jgi:hypothetical protein
VALVTADVLLVHHVMNQNSEISFLKDNLNEVRTGLGYTVYDGPNDESYVQAQASGQDSPPPVAENFEVEMRAKVQLLNQTTIEGMQNLTEKVIA